MNKRTLITILLLLIFVAMLTSACIDGSGSAGGTNGAAANGTPVPPHIQATLSADATSTYAADQFLQQLTAVAEENQNP